MKNRRFETALFILFLAHNLSSAGDLSAILSSGDTRIDEKIPQEKTIPPPGVSAILGGCDARPVCFSDGLEAAVSL